MEPFLLFLLLSLVSGLMFKVQHLTFKVKTIQPNYPLTNIEYSITNNQHPYKGGAKICKYAVYAKEEITFLSLHLLLPSGRISILYIIRLGMQDQICLETL